VFQNLVLNHAQTEKLLGSGKIDHVNFTGSVAGGRAIEKAAAGTFMTLGLELGGKDPAYVLPDAKMDHAVEPGRRRVLQFRPVLLRHRAHLCAREGL
jgi:acyl-CoA reductase-like NAD-dependent aldehyde dehydrogenase